MRDMLGAPIVYDEHRRGFYYEKEWHFLSALRLEHHKAEALMATKKVLSLYQGTPYYHEVSRALDKVLRYLPGTVSEDALLDIYSFGHPDATTESIRYFDTLELALRERRKVVITYNALSKSGECSLLTIHPYRLHYSQQIHRRFPYVMLKISGGKGDG